MLKDPEKSLSNSERNSHNLCFYKPRHLLNYRPTILSISDQYSLVIRHNFSQCIKQNNAHLGANTCDAWRSPGSPTRAQSNESVFWNLLESTKPTDTFKAQPPPLWCNSKEIHHARRKVLFDWWWNLSFNDICIPGSEGRHLQLSIVGTSFLLLYMRCHLVGALHCQYSIL